MAFKLEAFQNRFLPAGQTRVDAIVTVTADADVPGGGAGEVPLVVGFILDKSGSMAGERIEAARSAIVHAITMLPETARFFVVGFDANAHVFVGELTATPANKTAAAKAVNAIPAGGGTAMSSGLAAARDIFAKAPSGIHQAIFLTDGKNESDTPARVTSELAASAGHFQCDGWGVGTDWHVADVQQIAGALLGRASLIPDPTGIAAAFRAAIEKASAKALKDVRLRVWAPQGARIAFVKQVNPTIEDFTGKERTISPQIHEFFTGSWGPGESRDFHIAIDVKAGNVSDEMLAARPSVVFLESVSGAWQEREEKSPEARVFATWTGDEGLSSRIDQHVAHYTGQGDLARAIQEGMEMRERGEEAKATQMLGRAVQIAHQSGNAEMTQRLAKVVDVIDAPGGTVMLKRRVDKAAAMDLELESRTTKRVAKKAEQP